MYNVSNFALELLQKIIIFTLGCLNNNWALQLNLKYWNMKISLFIVENIQVILTADSAFSGVTFSYCHLNCLLLLGLFSDFSESGDE